jgi:hypothetical protein
MSFTSKFFGEVDETQSWYFRKNVEKQYGRNSDLDLDDPDLVNNNRIQGVFDFLLLFYLVLFIYPEIPIGVFHLLFDENIFFYMKG